MEPLVLRAGERIPDAILNDVVERERPVLWLTPEGCMTEAVSNAWVKHVDIHWYQRALPGERFSVVSQFRDLGASDTDIRYIEDLFQAMETQLKTIQPQDFDEVQMWVPFSKFIQSLLAQRRVSCAGPTGRPKKETE